MSPNLLIALAILVALAVVAGAVVLIPSVSRRSQIDRLVKAHERATEGAAEAYADDKPGLAEVHMERAGLIAKHIDRLNERGRR